MQISGTKNGSMLGEALPASRVLRTRVKVTVIRQSLLLFIIDWMSEMTAYYIPNLLMYSVNSLQICISIQRSTKEYKGRTDSNIPTGPNEAVVWLHSTTMISTC